MKPKVSVIMGVLYDKKYIEPLRNSINSILNQSYTNFEFLICADGSSSMAKELIEEYCTIDSRVRLIVDRGRKTLAEKLNALIEESRGEYIARMDDDDFSHRERLAEEVKLLNDNPKVDFAGTNVFVTKNGKQVYSRILPEHPKETDFLITLPYVHPTLIFRKKVLCLSGGYSQKKNSELCEDYELIMRLVSRGYKGVNIQKELLEYSIPENGHRTRKLIDCLHECITRYYGFKNLKILPKGLLYVLKPLAYYFIPTNIYITLKRKYYGR